MLILKFDLRGRRRYFKQLKGLLFMFTYCHSCSTAVRKHYCVVFPFYGNRIFQKKMLKAVKDERYINTEVLTLRSSACFVQAATRASEAQNYSNDNHCKNDHSNRNKGSKTAREMPAQAVSLTHLTTIHPAPRSYCTACLPVLFIREAQHQAYVGLLVGPVGLVVGPVGLLWLRDFLKDPFLEMQCLGNSMSFWGSNNEMKGKTVGSTTSEVSVHVICLLCLR